MLKRILSPVITAVLCAATSIAGPIAYVGLGGTCIDPSCLTYRTTLGVIDFSTGAFTRIGATDGFVPNISGLANGNGGLYAGDAVSNTVNLVNPATGTFTNVGTANVGAGNVSILGSTMGVLYELALPSMNLYSFNPANGSTTLIGPTGIPAPAADLSNLFGVTLTGLGGSLYASYLLMDPQGNPLLPDNLYRINPATAQALMIAGGLSGAECVSDIATVSNSVYVFADQVGGCSSPATYGIFGVNLATAQAGTSLSHPARGPVLAAAGVPEPASFVTAGLGLLMLGLGCRVSRSKRA